MPAITTVATIKHRHQTAKPERPSMDVSRDRWNDSEPVDSAAVDGAIAIRDSVQTDGWGFQARRAAYHLGGSRLTSLPLASGVENAIDWVDMELDLTQFGSLTKTLQVQCRVDSGATFVIPQLYNVTDDIVFAGVACSATEADYSGTQSKQSITITQAGTGNKVYRLRGARSNGDNPTYIAPSYLEIGG